MATRMPRARINTRRRQPQPVEPTRVQRSSVIIEKIGNQARVYQHGRLVMTVPLDKHGAVDLNFAFKRLLDVQAGTRRGKKRNVTLDQNRVATQTHSRSDIGAFMWLLYPNESDLRGVDDGKHDPVVRRVRIERDLTTVPGVDEEIRALSRKLAREHKFGRDISEIMDALIGMRQYRDGLVEGLLGPERFENLLEARDALGDVELVLAGREEAADAIERPRGTQGLSNEILLQIAEAEGRNPYAPDWGDSLDPVILKEARQGRSFKQGGIPTITELRREVRVLRADINELDNPDKPNEPAPAAVIAAAGPPPAHASSTAAMQTGMGIGEKAPQGDLLGGFRDDGGKVALIDSTNLVERQRLGTEAAKGQQRLKDPRDKRRNLLDADEISRRQARVDAKNRTEVRRQAKLADDQARTVPYDLRTLVEARVPNDRIRRVIRRAR